MGYVDPFGNSLLIGLAFMEPLRKAAREHQAQRAHVTAFAMSIFSGVAVLKSLLAESAMYRRFKQRSDRQTDLAKREANTGLAADAVPYSVAEIAGVSILAVVGWLVLSGKMEVARGIALWQLSTQAIIAFIRVPVRWVGLQASLVAWERLAVAPFSEDADYRLGRPDHNAQSDDDDPD